MNEIMIKIYVDLIGKKVKTLEEVPEVLREQVKVRLDEVNENK